MLLFKWHNQLLRNVFRPNRNVFDTIIQFNGLAGLPSYLQRSCYIPKHRGKRFKTDQVENANFFTAAKLLCIPWLALLVSKPTKWLRLFFVPKHLVMSITVYQTNTEHRAVRFYNESNAQNKLAFKCWSCHAFNVLHQLSRFFALCFAIFADEVGLYFVCSPLSSLETFRSICVTLYCKRKTARYRT